MIKYNENDGYYYRSYGTVTRDQYVEDTLKFIGKVVFVRYYYDFRRQDPGVYTVITEDYTEASKKRRTKYAISLFRQGLEKHALQNVMNSKRIERCYSDMAKSIYSCEFDKDGEVLGL